MPLSARTRQSNQAWRIRSAEQQRAHERAKPQRIGRFDLRREADAVMTMRPQPCPPSVLAPDAGQKGEGAAKNGTKTPALFLGKSVVKVLDKLRRRDSGG